MITAKLYLIQRISALLMAPLVIAHLIGIIMAVQGGLTADEILGRTQGSLGWMCFYGAFVILVAVHGTIGLRSILIEWTPIANRIVDALSAVWLISALILGLRAVVAVTWS